MAWVRYDDQFHGNRKVTAVIAESVDYVAALGLHTLANTWSNGTRWPGFVPRHQPNILVCDRERGAEWAAVLVRHRLWHDVAEMCDACQEEYADLPGDLDGFVFHNAKEYRPPARERTTPGTPADLSEKRREAGRAGGKASAAKREQAKQGEQANQANGVSKTSNTPSKSVSPVPEPVPVVASNEATTKVKTFSSDADASDQEDDHDEATDKGEPVREDVERVCAHLADRIEANGSKRPTIGKRWRDAARLLMDADGRSERQVHNMIDWCQNDEFWRGNVMSMPKLRSQYDQMRLKATTPANGRASPGPKRATTDERVAQAQALKAKFAANPPTMIAGEISP
jgi:hypothetical protein